MTQLKFHVAIVNVTLLLFLLHLVKGELECSRVIIVNATTGNNSQGCLQEKEDLVCSSLDNALNDSQNNDCVNITSDSVSLSGLVDIGNLTAIAIRGLGNTTVICSDNGRITCKNCSNVVIEGITWNGCGDPKIVQNGGLNFEKIANLSIKNCTFQFSKSRALTIWTVSGLIEMLDTRVVNNANYDNIYCYQDGTEYRCTTEDCYNITGGVRIQENQGEANVSIVNCTFEHNGHFGKIMNVKSKCNVSPIGREISDGVGLLFYNNNSYNNVFRSTSEVNLLIENTTFSSNRGRTGAGASIITVNSARIIFVNATFKNNSAITFRVNSSAFMVFIDYPNTTMLPFVPQLQLSMCSFYDNRGGRNMIDYIVEGTTSEILIENCIFANNSAYDITMVELNLHYTNSSVSIMHSKFTNNSGTAVVYFQIRSKFIMTTLFNLIMMDNGGFATEKEGGLILIEISEDEYILNITRLSFIKNYYASNGGGIYVFGSFQSSFQGYIQNSEFIDNFGFGSGTILHSSLSCATEKTYIILIDDCKFIHNEGSSIVYVAMEYYVLPMFLMLRDSVFSNNTGTPLHLYNAALVGNGNTRFVNNSADLGAALHLSNSYVLLNYTSFQLDLESNLADSYGGAIFVEFQLSNINHSQCFWLLYPKTDFCNVTMHNYSGCIVVMYTLLFCKLFPREEGIAYNISIKNNTALLSGSAIFYDDAISFPLSQRSPNISDPSSIFNIPEGFLISPNASEPNSLILSTQPEQLKLYNPAVCNDDYSICTISRITLGEEIQIPAEILGYNNKTAEATRFFVECIKNCNEFRIDGDSIVLISNMLSGITITGDEVRQNASTTLNLQSGVIDLKLNINLVPCQLGYAYNKDTRQCHCYSVDNIVSCGSNTTIKKDYWFGMIGEQATVSPCPNKYCNFSRTEITSGSFLLPLYHNDQCGSHRTGQACGNCNDGYTLAFDFDDCVNDDDCSPGITILIIICVILYWIIIIVIILVIMYFKINIGYLYGIIYYYSVVDILLGQAVNYSDGLIILDIIIASIVRLSPGFVGFFCFAKGMSGIDQYVLRFVHPTGVIIILTILGYIARHSRRVTHYISNGIIPAICLILTLTYTSIADTALYLFQPLEFTDINRDYTYLSPDYEYLTGRHIIYFIIALLYELVIVVGLPLLLLLEPFTKRWINFSSLKLICVKVSLKPILDQFQGCYKDNCRWFAAVYLICRQAILIILVINFTEIYVELYLLVIVCLITALFHCVAQPYNKRYDALNKFDAFILLLLVLVISLQIISVSNGLTTDAIVGFAFVFVLFPIIVYIVAMSCIKASSKDDGHNNDQDAAENMYLLHQ